MYTLDKITRRVGVKISGRDYSLAFSLSGLQELEKYLGNINTLFTSGNIPSFTQLVTAFWIALKGGGQNLDKQDAEPIISAFCREYGIEELTRSFFLTLALSGFLGKKGSDVLLKNVLPEESDVNLEEEKPRKNALKARRSTSK